MVFNSLLNVFCISSLKQLAAIQLAFLINVLVLKRKTKSFSSIFQLPFNFDNIQEVNEADLNGKEVKSTAQAMSNSSVFLNGSSLAFSSLCSLPWFGLFPLWQVLLLPPVVRRIFYFPFSHIKLFCPVLSSWIVIERESQ